MLVTYYVFYYILTETSFQLQLFLGTMDKVYIVDMTENNPPQSMVTLLGQLLRGPSQSCENRPELEPPHSPEFSISKNVARPLDPITNSFCGVRGSALSCLQQSA
jgi:hypothetical protein